MKELKISIVTVSFNQGQFIRDNIESVLSQDYSNYEHIIIDGGSKDNTVAILKEYPHLNWISEKDKGQSDGLNKGFKKATGDVIAWINSDDMLAPHALKYINEFFVNNPDKYVLTGNQVFIDEKGCPMRTIPAESFSYNTLLNTKHCSVMQNSTFFRKDVLLDVGYLDEKFHYTMDLELFIRIAKKYRSYTIKRDLAYFRKWEDSKTCSSQFSFFKEIRLVKKKHHAPLLTSGNVWLLWQYIKEPFKRIVFLRRIIKKIKGNE
ncbi:glycosyltransferase family 2 protein [Phocaeicola sp.]